MGQLREIESELLELGFQILAISPDSSEKIAELTKSDEYAYTLLSDAGNVASSAFGLAFKVENEGFQKFLAKNSTQSDVIPVPAVYIIGTDLKIQFQYVNPDYKTRIDSQTVLSAARFAAGKRATP